MAGYAPDTTTGSAATTDWRHNGACASHPNPNLWHPTGKPGARSLQAEEAKTICRQCPVIEQCAAWALATRQNHGIYGGFDGNERRAILRRRQRAAAKEAA